MNSYDIGETPVDENEMFEAITSGNGQRETVSEGTTTNEPVAPSAIPEANSQPRDEGGKFKASQQPQESAETATTETHATEPQNNGNGVPVAAVQAEREKRKAAESALEEMRRELAELRGTVTALRQPVQPQQSVEQQPATIWDNPDEFVKSQLNPLQKQMMEQREFVSETLAVQAYGAETVDAAKKAIEAKARTPEGQAIIQRVMQSRHPFDDLVKWHKREETLRTVGDDPQKFIEQQKEALLSDPQFLAMALERARTSASANPSTRSPITNIPPSLSSIPSGGGNASPGTEQSDAGLFTSLTSRRR